MKLRIQKTEKISGAITPPSSKSQTVRALLIATMAKGTSTILNALVSDDTDQAVRVCSQLGAVVRVRAQGDHHMNIEIDGDGIPLTPGTTQLFSGDSGITTRFVLPMLGLRSTTNPILLDCGAQMRERPSAGLVNALNALGMQIVPSSGNHGWPLSCIGSLQGGAATVDGITSQYCSALLLSLPCVPHDSVLTVDDLHERPYVEMTCRWLDRQKISYHWQKNQGSRDIIEIRGNQRYKPFTTMVPGDFSSSSYLIAAGVLRGGEVVLQGLDMTDAQGDKRFIPILQEMGADITIKDRDVIVRGERPLKGLTIDCNDIPDLVPTLAVVATQAQGGTHLVNVGQARLKETDRLHSMRSELTKMGAVISEKPDGLVIHQSDLHGDGLHGYSDHRTIMALAVAGLVAEGTTTIDTAEGINKTFPNFIEMMQSIRASVTLID